MKKIIIVIAAVILSAVSMNAQGLEINKNLFFKDICNIYLQYEKYMKEANSAESWEKEYKEGMLRCADQTAESMAAFYLLGSIRHKNAFLALDKSNPVVKEKLHGISTEILNIMKIVSTIDSYSYSKEGKLGAALLLQEYENKIYSIEDELFAIIS